MSTKSTHIKPMSIEIPSFSLIDTKAAASTHGPEYHQTLLAQPEDQNVNTRCNPCQAIEDACVLSVSVSSTSKEHPTIFEKLGITDRLSTLATWREYYHPLVLCFLNDCVNEPDVHAVPCYSERIFFQRTLKTHYTFSGKSDSILPSPSSSAKITGIRSLCEFSELKSSLTPLSFTFSADIVYD